MRKLIIVTLMLLLPIELLSDRKSDAKNDVLIFNDTFINALLKEDAVSRDDFLSTMYNRIVTARGYVVSAEEKGEYKRKYRITIADSLSSGKIDIKYFVYTDNKEYMQILHKSDIFEFKGQFVMATPLNSRRDSYILDIILQDGALVVE